MQVLDQSPVGDEVLLLLDGPLPGGQDAQGYRLLMFRLDDLAGDAGAFVRIELAQSIGSDDLVLNALELLVDALPLCIGSI